MRNHHLIAFFSAASIFLLAGCGMNMPTPTVAITHHPVSVQYQVDHSRVKAFCHTAKCTTQRFIANGPATLAVAHLLQIGVFSSRAHSSGSEGLLSGGMEVAGSGLVGSSPGLGAALFLLGASSPGSLPKWAANNHYMNAALRIGTVLQVVHPYTLGADPLQQSRLEATRLGNSALSYLSSLTRDGKNIVTVSGSEYAQPGQTGDMNRYFIGTAQADHQGNLSLIWWTQQESSSALSDFFTGSSHPDFKSDLLGKTLFHTTSRMVSGDVVLSRIECLPVPGSTGKAFAVATFFFRKPAFLIGQTAYHQAVHNFSADYLAITSNATHTSRHPGSLLIFHKGHAHVMG